MELNGSHIGYSARVSYRQRSWKSSIPNARIDIYITQVHHREDGKVKLDSNNYWFPADADVELFNRFI
jgi:hypothetical protein